MLYYYKVKKHRGFRIKEMLLATLLAVLALAYFYPDSLANVMPVLERPSLPQLNPGALSSKSGIAVEGIQVENTPGTVTLEKAVQVKKDLEEEGRRREAAELQYSLDLIAQIDKNTPEAQTRIKIIMQDIDKTISYFLAGNTASEKMEILKDYEGANLAYVYYPNYGVHFNPVTTANMALQHYSKGNHEKFVAITDELLDCAIEPTYPGVGAYYIWENHFDLEFGSRKFAAPWNSAMAQGLILDLAGKCYEITGDKKYLRAGEKILNSFRVPWDKGGVTDYDEHGNWYLEVAATDQLKILNGFLFTLDSLHDYHERTGNKKALKLFDAGIAEAKEHLGEYDLGYWSNYSLVKGNKASYEYHKIHATLLYRLYEFTGEATFKEYADKFNNYLKYNFIDIPQEHRSFKQITALSEAGIITNENGWFGPHNVMTKTEFAMWLCRIKNWSPNKVFHGYYRDVGRDRSNWSYIETLKERGVDLGDKDGLFNPDDEVTRDEAAAILSAAYNTPIDGKPTMRDVPADHKYYNEIRLAVGNELISLYGPNFFRPDLKLTREQAALTFYRLLDR
ncbi:MAG: D-glucuronyl C5-epimerase family protein [Actinomycetota bacterium]|nr:D-glucuronyl C5-epimerase family protein [Actinomycetota bacterium]